MKVYEIGVNVQLKKNINLEDASTFLSRFIDMNFSKNEEMYSYHNEKIYKGYNFDSFHTIEENKIYCKGKKYNFRIRTIEEKIAKFLLENLFNFENEDFKTISLNIKILPKKMIEKIYTITPALMKNKEGYWRYFMNFEDFEKRLKINCLKKYIYFTNKGREELINSEILKELGLNKEKDIELFSNIKFNNKLPVPIIYKGKKLVGDKLELEIANNERAQEIAYMLLGIGLLENCARGCGFLGYRFYE